MSLAIAVTYDNTTGFYTPGFEIVVSGLSGITDADNVLVQRQDNTSGAMDDVRGLSNTLIVADSAVATDFEYPYFNDQDGWQYVCYVYDDSGTQLATVTSATFTGLETVIDLSVEFPETSVVLASITQPAISIPVIINDFPSWTIPPNVLSTLKPLGRPNPVVLTDVFGGRTGTFTIVSDPSLSGIIDQYLVRLLTYNDTLLFQPYYASGNIGNMYFKVTGISATRETYAESAGTLDRQTSTVMLYAVDFTEVDRPIAGSAATTLISWQDVADNNTTWQDVLDGHPNWLDVLNNPTG